MQTTKQSAETLKQLIFTNSAAWQRQQLEQLTAQHLNCLFMVVGTCRYSHLKKQERITKMLEQLAVRLALMPFKLTEITENEAQKKLVTALSKRFNGKFLKQMCRTVGVYAPSTKYGMAASLLQWLNDCTKAGKKFVDEINQRLRERPYRQTSLSLWDQ